MQQVSNAKGPVTGPFHCQSPISHANWLCRHGNPLCPTRTKEQARSRGMGIRLACRCP
ncbi:hypothetical protein AERO9A_230018 [Aeromonas salmonicida]|nr:hypothetical protein AERO9A_230018 [Aeromonas salmonicida]